MTLTVPEGAVLLPIKISYSKAQAFKTCKMKFKYAHVELHEDNPKKPGLMPKVKSPALTLGSHGHAIMEHAMNAIKETPFPYTQEACKEAAQNAIVWGLSQPDSSLTPKIMKQILHFLVNVFPTKGWQILAVEEQYMLPIGTDEVSGRPKVYPFTVDLVIMLNGRIYIVDWKFAADAYKQERIDIEPQIPGYIGAMRVLGIPVVSGFYGFLRTRDMKNVEDQVVVSPVVANDIRIKRSFKEHLSTTEEIIVWERGDQFATRNTNNNCNYCDFNILCGIELRGDDASLMKKHDFLPNDYGYEEL